MMRNKWFGLIVLAIAFLFGLTIFDQLPELMAVQWNGAGEVTNTMSRAMATFVVPTIGIGIWALMVVVPRIDPKKSSFEKFAGTYWLIVNCVMIVVALAYVAQMLIALGIELPIAQIGVAIMGLLFLVLGNEMGRFRPNWFAGIRTPWTLSNDEVWRRTHRLGGRLFFGSGIAMLIIGLLVSPTLAFGMILTLVFGVVIFLGGYSYWLFNRLENQTATAGSSKKTD